jgi:hypothetical protein
MSYSGVVNGTHWTLLLAFTTAGASGQRCYLFFDSLGADASSECWQLAVRLVNLLGPPGSRLLRVRNAIRQQNSADCGVCCLLTVQRLLMVAVESADWTVLAMDNDFATVTIPWLGAPEEEQQQQLDSLRLQVKRSIQADLSFS